MGDFKYDLSEPTERTLGLIVLQTDERIEHDFRRLICDSGTKLLSSRVPNAPEVTRETLGAMKTDLPNSANLFPNAAHFDVIGYGCTSASSVIGAEGVEQLIKSTANTVYVTNPMTALIRACHYLKINKLAFLSPYIEDVSKGLCDVVNTAGISTPLFGSFNESNDSNVARITPSSIRDAAIELGKSDAVQAVFLSCTNLNTLDVIDEIEEVIQKPVISSNQVLAWDMMRLAGGGESRFTPGCLLKAIV